MKNYTLTTLGNENKSSENVSVHPQKKFEKNVPNVFLFNIVILNTFFSIYIIQTRFKNIFF